MAIRVLINGANGKMGQCAVKTLTEHPDFTVVAKTGRQNNLAAEIKASQAEVVVDLTNAEVVLKNALTIIDAGVHPVIGTTGLIKEQIEMLQQRCAEKKLGGIIAPNFSLGALLMIKYAKEIAHYFPHVEIIEMHHNGKLDSPSGTAMRTAEMLAAGRTQKLETLSSSREIVPHARGASYQDISIHSVRLPGLVAHQQLIFGGTGETLTIRHDSIDRQCFMPGVVLACQKVMGLKQLIYGLEQLL